MAISYVGGKGAGTAGQGGGSIDLTTGLTGGSGGAPLAGDIVFVTVSVGTAARQPTIAISTPSGYTALTAQRTTATTYDTNVQTCYKVMGATPDTTVTIPASGNNADGIAYSIQVFRGVDTTNPMDVTPTYATGSGTNNLPNPAAITPVTAGAWIVVCGGGAASAGGTYAASGLTNFLTYNGPDNNDGNVGSGYYTGWTSGAYDPAAFTGGSANATNSWGATTIALRPAVTNYPLTCNSGSYSYTGSSATVTRNRALTSNAGSYAYTGSSAELTKGAALNHRSLTAESGSYAYTGSTASLVKGKHLIASAGSYTYAGSTATLLRSRLVVSNAGSYAYTGSSAGLGKGKTVGAQAGSYAVTGSTATVLRSRSLTCSAGSYAYSGQSATLAKGRRLVTTAGSYAYSGSSAALVKGKRLITTAGSYTYAGSVATLVKGRSLLASPGAYTYTGSTAVLLRNRALVSSQGSYAYTGSSATLTKGAAAQNYALTALAGSYTYTGQSADITKSTAATGYSLTALAGAYTLTGQSTTLLRSRTLLLNPGGYVISGGIVEIFAGAMQRPPGRAIYVMSDRRDAVAFSSLSCCVATTGDNSVSVVSKTPSVIARPMTADIITRPA